MKAEKIYPFLDDKHNNIVDFEFDHNGELVAKCAKNKFKFVVEFEYCFQEAFKEIEAWLVENSIRVFYIQDDKFKICFVDENEAVTFFVKFS